jgi:hypothetical protein
MMQAPSSMAIACPAMWLDAFVRCERYGQPLEIFVVTRTTA